MLLATLAIGCETAEPVDSRALGAETASVLSFTDDWQVTASGTVTAGAAVIVDYDLDRLPQCFGDTYMGQRTWNTHAYVTFDTQVEAVAYPLVGCDDARCDSPFTVPAEIAVPADASTMTVWFATAGRACGAHWDSAYGANYQFDVQPATATGPAWMGNAVVRISRDSSDACAGGAAASEGFFFGTWARQRSTVSNACFEVWEPGVTDFDNPDLWKQLDVRGRYRFGAGEPWSESYVSLDRRVGNNARYAWSLRGIDPFFYYNCPDVPTEVDGEYIEAEVEYYFTVNGVALRPAGGNSTFHGTYQDYEYSPFREENCP